MDDIKEFLGDPTRTNEILRNINQAQLDGRAPYLSSILDNLILLHGAEKSKHHQDLLYKHAKSLKDVMVLVNARESKRILATLDRLADSKLSRKLNIQKAPHAIPEGVLDHANELFGCLNGKGESGVHHEAMSTGVAVRVGGLLDKLRDNRLVYSLLQGGSYKPKKDRSFGFWYEQRLQAKNIDLKLGNPSQAASQLLRSVLQDAGIDPELAASMVQHAEKDTIAANVGKLNMQDIQNNLNEMPHDKRSEWIKTSIDRWHSKEDQQYVAALLGHLAQALGTALKAPKGQLAGLLSLDTELFAATNEQPANTLMSILRDHVIPEDPRWAEPALRMMLRRLRELDPAQRAAIADLTADHFLTSEQALPAAKRNIVETWCLSSHPDDAVASVDKWRSSLDADSLASVMPALCLSHPEAGAQLLQQVLSAKAPGEPVFDEKTVELSVRAAWLASPDVGKRLAGQYRVALPDEDPPQGLARQLIKDRLNELEDPNPGRNVIEERMETLPHEMSLEGVLEKVVSYAKQEHGADLGQALGELASQLGRPMPGEDVGGALLGVDTRLSSSGQGTMGTILGSILGGKSPGLAGPAIQALLIRLDAVDEAQRSKIAQLARSFLASEDVGPGAKRRIAETWCLSGHAEISNALEKWTSLLKSDDIGPSTKADMLIALCLSQPSAGVELLGHVLSSDQRKAVALTDEALGHCTRALWLASPEQADAFAKQHGLALPKDNFASRSAGELIEARLQEMKIPNLHPRKNVIREELQSLART